MTLGLRAVQKLCVCLQEARFSSRLTCGDYFEIKITKYVTNLTKQSPGSRKVRISVFWPVREASMQTSRRDFFKLAAVGGVAATVFGFDLKPAYAQLKQLKIARAAETRSTCPPWQT
jgi:hypothetical protein